MFVDVHTHRGLQMSIKAFVIIKSSCGMDSELLLDTLACRNLFVESVSHGELFIWFAKPMTECSPKTP